MNTNEVWKDIKEYVGVYQVSSLGNVRRVSSGRKHKRSMIVKPDDNHGYHRMRLSKNGMVKKYYVHRLVVDAFLPQPVDNQHVVHHLNHIRFDNRLENLQWVSPLWNNKEANTVEGRIILAINFLKQYGYTTTKNPLV